MQTGDRMAAHAAFDRLFFGESEAWLHDAQCVVDVGCSVQPARKIFRVNETNAHKADTVHGFAAGIGDVSLQDKSDETKVTISEPFLRLGSYKVFHMADQRLVYVQHYKQSPPHARPEHGQHVGFSVRYDEHGVADLVARTFLVRVPLPWLIRAFYALRSGWIRVRGNVSLFLRQIFNAELRGAVFRFEFEVESYVMFYEVECSANAHNPVGVGYLDTIPD